MIFLGKSSRMLRDANALELMKEYTLLTGERFPAANYENWPGGAQQFLDTLRARLAELKAEKLP